MKKIFIILFTIICLSVQLQAINFVAFHYSGNVFEKNTLAPISNHPVTIEIDSAYVGFSWSYTTHTDAYGHFNDTIWVDELLLPTYFYLYTIDASNNRVDTTYLFNYTTQAIYKNFYINTSCFADFISDQGVSPNEIEFFDLSEGCVYHYEWDFGDGMKSTQNEPVHQYSFAGNYTVTLKTYAYNHVTNSYCQDSISKNITVGQMQYHLLGGQVFAGPFPYDEGYACLYQMHQNNYIVPVDSFSFDTLGYYYFDSVPEGNYLVKIFTDQLYYKTLSVAPTYYGNTLFWETSNYITLTNNQYNNDIHLIEFVEPTMGIASLSLQVCGSIPLFQNHEILLLNSNRDVVGWDYSDCYGNIYFDNLAYGHYIVTADVTGLISSELHFDLTPSNPYGQGHIYLVPGTTGNNEIDTDITENLISSIYPNPSYGIFNINSSNNTEMVDIKIMDITGKIMLETNVPKKDTKKTIDISGNATGVYIIQASSSTKTETHKIIIQ
jgi:PKD repeat protein